MKQIYFMPANDASIADALSASFRCSGTSHICYSVYFDFRPVLCAEFEGQCLSIQHMIGANLDETLILVFRKQDAFGRSLFHVFSPPALARIERHGMNGMFLAGIDFGEPSIKKHNTSLYHLMPEPTSQTINGALKILNTQPFFVVPKHIKLYWRGIR